MSYKIGDNIYYKCDDIGLICPNGESGNMVKGTITKIDNNDKKYPYYMEYSSKSEKPYLKGNDGMWLKESEMKYDIQQYRELRLKGLLDE